MKIIINPQFHLREVTLEDAEELFLLTEDNREHLRAFLPWVDATQNVGDTRAFIASTSCDSVYSGKFALALIWEQKIVGMIDFHNGDHKNKSLEIGYWLSKSYNGKGLMTLACKSLIDYAFRETDANRIIVRCAVNNPKSQAIPNRLGLIQEGIEREANWINGLFVNLYRNSVLRSEWKF